MGSWRVGNETGVSPDRGCFGHAGQSASGERHRAGRRRTGIGADDQRRAVRRPEGDERSRLALIGSRHQDEFPDLEARPGAQGTGEGQFRRGMGGSGERGSHPEQRSKELVAISTESRPGEQAHGRNARHRERGEDEEVSRAAGPATQKQCSHSRVEATRRYGPCYESDMGLL